MKKIFPLIASLLLASGCTSYTVSNRGFPNTQAEWDALDCGPRPDNYEELINNWIKMNFKDPYSIRDLVIQPPVKAVFREALITGGKKTPCWYCGFKVNAKNSYGAYVGSTPHLAYIRDGVIIRAGDARDF